MEKEPTGRTTAWSRRVLLRGQSRSESCLTVLAVGANPRIAKPRQVWEREDAAGGELDVRNGSEDGGEAATPSFALVAKEVRFHGKI